MSTPNVAYLVVALLMAAACGSNDPTKPPQPASESSPSSNSEATASEPAAMVGSATPSATPSGSEGISVETLVPAPGAADPAPAAGSAGCGQSASLANGQQTLSVGGVDRTFLLDLPRGYDPNVAYPLVFGFHGATTSATLFRSTRYGNLLSAMGDVAIVVHADALGNPTAWNNQADVPFFDAMLQLLEQSLCVDEQRVFATGHSSGGFFTNTLGCQRGDVLRAIAPVSGGGPFNGARCTGEVAVWLAHGENDMTVPFTTGEMSRDGWLGRNGCDTVSMPTGTPPECVDYAGCDEGLPVRWCVHQNGHNWPTFAPQAIWAFFSSL